MPLLATMPRATANACDVQQMPLSGRPPGPMESLGTVHRYGAGQRVYSQDESVEYWYRLADGAARKCTQIADGRRQIVDFFLPGDLFGFNAGGRHECSVESVVANTTVVRYQRSQMESLMESDPQLARRVRDAAFGSLNRMQSRMILLGRSRALERVCGFLLEMARRPHMETAGMVALPMSRYDIADYLAIAVETVSRSLTTLRSQQIIVFFDTRHFRIIDWKSLDAHCCR